MDYTAFLSALKPYGFRQSPVWLDAYRDADGLRVMCWPHSQKAEVWASMMAPESGRPPLFSGSPEETAEWFKQREGVTT